MIIIIIIIIIIVIKIKFLDMICLKSRDRNGFQSALRTVG